MEYFSNYASPLGEMLISADDEGLVGVWFLGQKYFIKNYNLNKKENEIIKLGKHFLDIYFKGQKPDFIPPIHFIGTPFQILVWEILKNIPYGEITTYGAIAKEIAVKKGIKKMSAQAVGNAVSHNKISIIVPCHRVIGSNGSLTGYAGGIDKKIKLLKLENTDTKNLSTPE